ncbi:unnamed protein product [Albugo candida]|uniref:6-phosphogluconolactonase n=1 Tax=Albugo candida TaxID=65357 RepID=A0A024GM39_9STRA|nr:unnamed protein product [Albugo candida]|eukprot:CCI47847.1 unnamed protein product [Albugo candida]
MDPISDSSSWVFIGSYTQKESHVDGKGEGIYCYRFSSHQTPHLQLVHVARCVGPNPSFLISKRLKMDGKKIILYAVNECSDSLSSKDAERFSIPLKRTGFVRTFVFDEVALILTQLQHPFPTLGSHPCHLAMNASNSFLTVSNYNGGSIALFPVDNGLLSPASLVKEYTAHSSTSSERQEAPHPHSTSWLSHQRLKDLLYVADLGNDCIYHLRLHAATNTLEDVIRNDASDARANRPTGSGPRHFVIHNTRKLVFILDELSSCIGVHEMDPVTGLIATEAVQNISTVPCDTKGNLCADIHISKCLRFLYASNRGHNSLAAFTIEAEATDGTYLKLIDFYPTLGSTPRSFSIMDDFVIVANQDSDTLQVFKVQKDDTDQGPAGALLIVQRDIHCLTPTSISIVKGTANE